MFRRSEPAGGATSAARDACARAARRADAARQPPAHNWQLLIYQYLTCVTKSEIIFCVSFFFALGNSILVLCDSMFLKVCLCFMFVVINFNLALDFAPRGDPYCCVVLMIFNPECII